PVEPGVERAGRGAGLFRNGGASDLLAEIEETVEQTARYLLRTADPARADRLWPADPFVFSTNPLSVAYGACGPALFLHRTGRLGEMPAGALAWMLDRPLTVEG